MKTKWPFLLKIILLSLGLFALKSFAVVAVGEKPLSKEAEIEEELKGSAELIDKDIPVNQTEALVIPLKEESPPKSPDNLVEVFYNPDPSLSYNQRKGRWSGIYAIEMNSLFPSKLQSPIDDKSFSSSFSGKKITLPEISAGIKYNLIIGGITADLSYGEGLISQDDEKKITRSLKLTKKGASLGYVMDKLFAEPYFAPYLRLQMYQFDYKETYGEAKGNKTTSPSSASTIGVLLQLNWIEKQLAREALEKHDLNNSFLDIFATKHSSPSKSDEPNMETGFDVGAGIKLEF